MVYPRNHNIDIGLHALCIHAEPGQILTQAEIAEVCGCTPQIIALTEKKAMDKLRSLPKAREIYEGFI